MARGFEPEPPIAVPPSTDLFVAGAPAAVASVRPELRRRSGTKERKPTAKGLAGAAAAGLLLSYLFDMPIVRGLPLPAGMLFTLGLVGIQRCGYVFFLALIGVAVAVYEWAMDGL